MCCCYGVLKAIRESSGSDALWMYDIAPASLTAPRGMHAIGPAPSLQSCVVTEGVVDTLGAIFDANGYMSTLFTFTYGYSPTPLIAAWNGTSTAWFWRGSPYTTFNDFHAFNLSGTRLSTTTPSSRSPRNRYGIACDSSGNLIVIAGTALQKRNTSGTLIGTTFTPNGSLYSWGDTCCVDSSDNIFVTTETYVRKYDSSLNPLWTNPLSMHHIAPVTDSAGALYVVSYNSGATELRKWNSSGTLQWTVTLPYLYQAGFDADMWCDGSSIYIAYGTTSSGFVREKYNSSGVLVWSEPLWWNHDSGGGSYVRSIRGNGSLIVIGSSRL